jgi:ABC-type phosphate transport system substrate-binding protein
MITPSTAARLGVAISLALGIAVAAAPGASADQAPTATDVVGVGSDIVQNTMDFISDGDTHGNGGYNTIGNKNRLISFDATADANGRNAFTDPSLGGAVVLNPTITLRAGTSPVQRPNGGSAGLTALINDGTGGVSADRISFARSPNLPTAAQQTQAQANLGTPLHTVEFAKDQQVIATATTTNAPATLSAQELVGIYNGTYTHWNQLPGNPGGSTDAIIPLIPQPGAGVRNIFLNALKAANGGTSVTLAGGVRNVQQNDPTTITGLSAAEKPDAIVPFPVGRYTLLSSGYFRDPSSPYNVTSPPTALSASGIQLEDPTGSPSAGDNNATFDAAIPYYIIFRESDFASSTAWQPGSTLNWVQELFFNPGGPAPFVNTAPVQAVLTNAGVTAHYEDFGNTTSG